MDVLTRNEIQFSALQAKILGTFYESRVGSQRLLAFGSDVETFYSASRYKVYKPKGHSLEVVTNHPELTELEEHDRQAHGTKPRPRVRIGTVRYSSSIRRRTAREEAVPVRVNVEDFIALKTAVFGMTRLGKSNTMKTIATAVFGHAAETGRKIGQLLFDPAGEYANPNQQDKTALSQIGPEYVTIFQFGAQGNDPGVRPLSTNFFADATIEVTWSIINSYLSVRNQTNYVASFLAADVVGPEKMDSENASPFKRSRRRRSALYATLARAGFQMPHDFRTVIVVNKDILAAVNQHRTADDTAFTASGGGDVRLTAVTLVPFWIAVVAANEATKALAVKELKDSNRPKKGGAKEAEEGEGTVDDKKATKLREEFAKWIDSELEAILAVFSGAVGSGYRLLEPLRTYHSLAREDDYCDEVLNELIGGKIVIIDLSLGSETVLKFCSERIINHIVGVAARRFADNKDPYPIQIFIEEAHRLFNRDRMNIPEEADPYVRLAKEAAKYKIGLIYATQEVSSVDPLIPSNTSNWIVTHLNNHAEVKELSKYYDFEDFADLTLRAEDVGFARLKTRSGRFIIPLQIDRFDDKRIEEARAAAHAALPTGPALF